MSDDLVKPCPFCGSNVVIDVSDDLTTGAFVCDQKSTCIESGLLTGFNMAFKDSAIAAWNTRADRIEVLEKALTNMQREYDKRGDRIEELEAQLSKKMDEDAYIAELEYKLDAAEAELANAVEAAYCEGFAEGYGGEWIEGDYSKPWRKSVAFAELKGEQP